MFLFRLSVGFYMVHLLQFWTHSQPRSIRVYTLSYTFQSLKTTFILVFISSRISSLVRLVFFGASFFFYPVCALLRSVLCATLSFLARRRLLRSFFLVRCFNDFCFQSEIANYKSTCMRRSIPLRIFIARPLASRKNVLFSKANRSSSGSSAAIYFYSFSLSFAYRYRRQQ